MNKYEVVIVDYNTGNVDSLLKAVKIFHKNAIISKKWCILITEIAPKVDLRSEMFVFRHN